MDGLLMHVNMLLVPITTATTFFKHFFCMVAFNLVKYIDGKLKAQISQSANPTFRLFLDYENLDASLIRKIHNKTSS